MIDKILSTVEKFNMISYGDRIVAGVSGGADSMLLLRFLLTVREKYSLDIIVAHIEHGIRGNDSVSDAEFVKEFCKQNDVEFNMISINAPEEARINGVGVEEYSRKKRYEYFNSFECDKIATAHNLTDNIETVLFRIARGTGLKGICGIPAVRGKIIRPLISLTSNEIRTYCENNSLPYRIDRTNSDNSYSRNYIRNVLFKDFNEVNSAFEKSASRFIQTVNEDEKFICDCAALAYKECFENGKLVIEKLRNYPVPIKKRVIINYFSSNGAELDELHLEKIISLLSKKSREQISGNFFAVSDGKYLRFADFTPACNNFKFVAENLKNSEFNPNSIDFYCDCDKIVGNIIVRKREEGDKISPAGRNCTKSIKKLFNELKIPREIRENIPVVCDFAGVIGIIGYCVDERVKRDKDTKNILSLKLLPSED